MDIINGSFRKKMKPKNADGNGLNVITKIIKNTKRRKANLRFVNQESENKMKQQMGLLGQRDLLKNYSLDQIFLHQIEPLYYE